jgi:hypothetical protein
LDRRSELDNKKFLSQYKYKMAKNSPTSPHARRNALAEARKDVALDKAESIQHAKQEDGYRKAAAAARKGTRYKE